MPRLTWAHNSGEEVRSARAVFDIYRRHGFIARHTGPNSTFTLAEFREDCSPLDFVTPPTAYDRLLREDDLSDAIPTRSTHAPRTLDLED